MASFGIASIIISVLAIFIPVFGIILSGLSGVMAWLSTGRGITFGAAAVIINFLNLFFLSPGYMIAAGIEASARDYEEHKLVVVWMIVLFIQIAAVVVFLINMFINNLPSISIKSKKTKRPKWTQQPSTDSQKNKSISNSVNSVTIDSEEAVSKVTKVLIHKVHGGRKKDSKFWNDDIDLSEKVENNFDIAIDPIKKKRKKEFQQPWMIPPTVVLITLVILIIARPDLFPFLDYHNVYKAVARIDDAQAGKRDKEERKPMLANYKQVSPITSLHPNQKNTLKKPSYSFKKKSSQVSSNHNYTGNDISLSGMVFSWKDEEGKRYFSNTISRSILRSLISRN